MNMHFLRAALFKITRRYDIVYICIQDEVFYFFLTSFFDRTRRTGGIRYTCYTYDFFFRTLHRRRRCGQRDSDLSFHFFLNVRIAKNVNATWSNVYQHKVLPNCRLKNTAGNVNQNVIRLTMLYRLQGTRFYTAVTCDGLNPRLFAMVTNNSCLLHCMPQKKKKISHNSVVRLIFYW